MSERMWLLVTVLALTSIVNAQGIPVRTPRSGAASRGCVTPSTSPDDVPPWTAAAEPPLRVPHAMSDDGEVEAFLFGEPLRAGHPRGEPGDPNNKILWVVHQPRGGRPLQITATRLDGEVDTVQLSLPANSGPGEIYPSIVDVPTAGCWHFALAWNGNQSAINLEYARANAASPRSSQ